MNKKPDEWTTPTELDEMRERKEEQKLLEEFGDD